MKKRNLKSLKLNKQSISKLHPSYIKGGASLACTDNTTTIMTRWLGCGASNDCPPTGSFACPTSAVICDHICPSDV